MHGISALLDPLSGGTMFEYGHSWWGGLLLYLGLPLAVVFGVMCVAARKRTIATAPLAIAVVPVALIVGLVVRDATGAC